MHQHTYSHVLISAAAVEKHDTSRRTIFAQFYSHTGSLKRGDLHARLLLMTMMMSIYLALRTFVTIDFGHDL